MVASYFRLLTQQLAGGVGKSKKQYLEQVTGLVPRNAKSVEWKSGNISHVLATLGLPYASGYKPAANVQHDLYGAVQDYLAAHPDLLTQLRRHPPREAVPLVLEAQEALARSQRDLGEIRESLRVQAALAAIGRTMSMDVWVPEADRGGVLRAADGAGLELLDELPVRYSEDTQRTIRNIDVLWLRGREILRAFEVEHTTAIYSGLLRMVDLTRSAPNLFIRLHIVAPEARRAKVLEEIRRPAFQVPRVLLPGDLPEFCTYLSYGAVEAIRSKGDLAHLNLGILEEYAEQA
jgi:hypothetical protein